MPGPYKIVEKFARNSFPSFMAPFAKKLIAWPRYYTQLKKSRSQYEQYKGKYNQPLLYVAGLPKSGTTWLEKMLCSFPGFCDVMIPEAVAFEQKHKQSHTFELPAGLFNRFTKALVVLKLHAHGSLHNYKLLEQNKTRYVVLYRDLRDVAVSHIFYVQRTAYHPEHKDYKYLDTKEALKHFAATLLPEFIKWVDSWQAHVASPLSYIVKYEDLTADPFNKLKEIAVHYGIQTTDDELQYIIKSNSFEKLSGGREKGVTDTSSFFRSGTSGDWKKYFDEETMALYNNLLAGFLIKYGYNN